ncbi:MAG: CARDB domain-containing protein [Patescibacteria group bacterium]
MVVHTIAMKQESTETAEKKSAILKSLAIIGFLSLIVLIAWLSVQIVERVPGAFSSLASLAESVRQYELPNGETKKNTPTDGSLIVTSNKTLLQSGEEVELAWTKARVPGTYVFRYECRDGVAIDIKETEGLRSLACAVNYNLGDTKTLSLVIDSEKNRYTDIAYSLAFLGTNDIKPRVYDNATLTVVNNELAEAVGTSTSSSDAGETEPSAPATNEASTGSVPDFTESYTYEIPISDPHGRADLATRFLNTGGIANNSFFTQAILKNSTGALQFEVKNLGTKTSDDWTYTVSLPNGEEYTSSTQTPLKPNERAVVAIGFTTGSQSNHTFTVTIDEDTDLNTTNDRFSQVVTFN